MLNQFAFTSDFLTILLGWDKTLLPLHGSDERSTHLSALFRSAITGYQVPSVLARWGTQCVLHISLFYKITIGWVRYMVQKIILDTIVDIQSRSFCLIAVATDISRAQHSCSAISLL